MDSYRNAQLITNNGSVVTRVARTAAVFVKTTGVVEVTMAGNAGVMINLGTVVTGVTLPLEITAVGTANTAVLIVLR